MAEITTQPRPTQFSTSDYGFSPLQEEYIKTLQNQPSQSEQYGKARESLGIGEQEQILSGMNRSVLDLEGKIKGVSAGVTDRTKDFLVTQAQKDRRINVEEAPLRDQYLELLRRREGQSGILSSLQGQLSNQMGYAQEDAGRNLSALEQMLKFQSENKTASSANGSTDMLTAALNRLNGTDTPTPDGPEGQTSVLDENTSNSLYDGGAFGEVSENVLQGGQNIMQGAGNLLESGVNRTTSNFDWLGNKTKGIFDRATNIYGVKQVSPEKQNSLLAKILRGGKK